MSKDIQMENSGGGHSADGGGDRRLSPQDAAAAETAARETPVNVAVDITAEEAQRLRGVAIGANKAAASAGTAARDAVAAADAAEKAVAKGIGEKRPEGHVGGGGYTEDAMKSTFDVPHLQLQLDRHDEAEGGEGTTLQQQQQHCSTDDSVQSDGAQQQEETSAAWQHGEEAAAFAAAAAAVEEGVEKELVAAAERSAAGTVKSRGPGSPRLRLFIMRQCSERGLDPTGQHPAEEAVAAALGEAAAIAAKEGRAPAAAPKLKVPSRKELGAEADGSRGDEGYGSTTSQRGAAPAATLPERAELELLHGGKEITTDIGAGDAFAAGGAGGGAAAAPRVDVHHHHHHHLLLFAEDDEEDDKRAAPDESICSNMAWSRRPNSKHDLMSISAADRDRLLLDTGHSLEDVEERWWKAYFADVEDLQRTRARIVLRREKLENLLSKQNKEGSEEKQESPQGDTQPRAEGTPGQDSADATVEQQQSKERCPRREGGSTEDQPQQMLDKRMDLGRRVDRGAQHQQQQQQQSDKEEDMRRRRLAGGLLTMQNWWEEVVETEKANSYITAAGTGNDKTGDVSRVQLSYKEIDYCANAVALWAVMAAGGGRRHSVGSTTWRGTSLGGSRGSSWSSTVSGPPDASFSKTQKPHTRQPHHKRETEKGGGNAQQLPPPETAGGLSVEITGESGTGEDTSSDRVLSTEAAAPILHPNDVVVLLLSHPMECLLLMLGLLKANLCPALVPTHLQGNELEDAVRAARPAYIICDRGCLEKLCAAVQGGSRSTIHTTPMPKDSASNGAGHSNTDRVARNRGDTGMIPAIETMFPAEGSGEASSEERLIRASLDHPQSAAVTCAAWFHCPTSLYGRRDIEAPSDGDGGKHYLLEEIEDVLSLCGVACDKGSSDNQKKSSNRELAGLCGVALPPRCPPLREVLRVSPAARLACRGITPCMSCLRKSVVATAATAVTKFPGDTPPSNVFLQTASEEKTGRSPIITGAYSCVGVPSPSANTDSAPPSNAGLGKRPDEASSDTYVCVYATGTSASPGSRTCCDANQWGALHAAVYFYATVPARRGITTSDSQMRRAAAEREAAGGSIERGAGGREAEEAEEVEKSLQPALLSHETLIKFGIAWRRRMQLDVRDVVYCPSSLQAETGCFPVVLAALEARASLVFPRTFDARYFWPHIDHFRCTYTTYFPEMWFQLFAAGDPGVSPTDPPIRSSAPNERQTEDQQKAGQGQQHTRSERQQEKEKKDEKKDQKKGARTVRRLRGCAGEGMTAEWWRRAEQEAGVTLKDFVEFHFRPHWPVSSPLINFNKKMEACGFVPNSVQGKRETARLVRYDQRRKMILRRPDSGRCLEAELRSKQEHRTGEAIVLLEQRQKWLGFANSEVTRSLLLENAFSSGDVWCRSGDLMDVDRLGFFYFVQTLG